MVRSPISSFAANAANSSLIRLEYGLVVVDQVHLVHREHQVWHPQQRGQEGVPPALLGQPVAGVHQDDREGRPVEAPVTMFRVVLDMNGGVGDDELPPRRGEGSGRRRRS